MPRQFRPVDCALTPSPDVLSALQAAGDSSSLIPQIRDASRLSVEVFEGTRGHNLDDKISNKLSLLANESCELVALLCAGSMAVNSTVSLDPLGQLVWTLGSIKRFAMKIRSRTRLGRLIKRRSDLVKIKDYREDLRRFRGVFNLATNISMHENLMFIMRQDQRAERDVPRSNQASTPPLQMNLSITNVNGNQYNYSDSLVNSNNAMNIVHGLTSASPVAVVGSA